MVQPRMLADPAQRRDLRDQLDRGAGLVQQGRGFKGALAGTDDRHTPPSEASNIAPLVAMRKLRRWQRPEFGRNTLKWANARRHDHAARAEHGTIVERDRKRSVATGHRGDLSAIQIRNSFPLKPSAVVDKGFERNRRPRSKTRHALVGIERGGRGRTGDIRGDARRTQQHAGGHLLRPELHRLPEALHLDAGTPQVRRSGQTVWTRSNDGNFALPHASDLIPYVPLARHVERRVDERAHRGRGELGTRHGRLPEPRAPDAPDRCLAQRSPTRVREARATSLALTSTTGPPLPASRPRSARPPPSASGERAATRTPRGHDRRSGSRDA